MRILLATPSMDVGGNERIVIDLARGLTARHHEITLFGPSGVLERELADVPLDRIVLRERGRSLAGLLWAGGRLTAAIARGRPDVVHAINPKMAAVAAAAVGVVPRLRPVTVSTFGNCPSAELPRAARILRRIDGVCPVSNELGDELIGAGLPPDRLRVIPPGVPETVPTGGEERSALDAELGLGAGPVALVIGRLVEQKNHLRMLESAVQVARRIPDVRFLVAGDGPLRETLERRAAELGLTRCVTFLGNRGDVASLLERSDVLVFSSDWEGLSVAALEALAAGTPVVTTPSQGMRELLGEGVGCVVGGFDSEALAGAIVDLLADEPRRREMARRGSSLVASRYSVEGMVEAYVELYCDLRRQRGLGGRRTGSSTRRA
jgi:glycosyltransferase involved in cell wall biosynthesis